MDWNRDTPSRKYRLRRILAVWRNRSLASFLVRIRTDPKTVQTLLHHSDVKLTLQCYTHSVSEDRMAAAGAMLTAIFSHAADRSGLKAD
jgi:integrase